MHRALGNSVKRAWLAFGLVVVLLSGCSTALPLSLGRSAVTEGQGTKTGDGCLPRNFTVATGSQLPAVRLSCLDGAGSVQLQQLRGQPVLINLWASWCAPCREEMPRISAALDAARTSGAVVPTVIGVDTKDEPSQARAFLASVHVGWPVLVDPDASLASALHVPGLPVTLGLDSTGAVVYRHIGELSTADAASAIRLIDRGAVAPASAPSDRKATT